MNGKTMSGASLQTSLDPAGAEADVRPDNTTFDDPNLFDWLYTATAAELDRQAFGIIVMSLDGTVEHYGATEGRYAGLTPSRVVGRNFFGSVAPCTNNFMVAERFLREPQLDDTIDYVFTLRMSPQKVRLRMLKRPTSRQMFLAVERRG
jgi:photoactive yellow protein